jgi:hypothetical protein
MYKLLVFKLFSHIITLHKLSRWLINRGKNNYGKIND